MGQFGEGIKNKKNRLFFWLFIVLASNATAFTLGSKWFHPAVSLTPHLETPAHAEKAPEPPQPKSGLLKETSESFRAVVKKVGPAVVTIKSTIGGGPAPRRGRARRPFPPQQPGPDDEGNPFNDPFFDFFRRFGGSPFEFQQPQEQTSLGSGFIIDKRGYIVTNNHVVKGASKVVVNLPGEEAVDIAAKVVGTDARTDLAVLKIETKQPFAVAEWADSNAVEVGDWAIAIGSPFMLSHTVTLGIVSAKERNSNLLGGGGGGQSMLQTDAAINPGNSGGPLCTVDGTVMGVNTAILSRSGGYMGIGFAIPSNSAKQIVETLIQGKKVIRGWLGVSIQGVDPSMAKELGIKGGALIHSIEPGSPAAKSGLRPGDVITDVGGTVVKDLSHVQQLVGAFKPGTRVKIKVVNYNDRKSRTVDVTVGQLPDSLAGEESEEGGDSGTPDLLGLSLAPASNGKGMRVVSVAPNSKGEEFGFQKNDVIVSINRSPINSLKAYENAVKGKKNLNILLRRQGQEVFLQIMLP